MPIEVIISAFGIQRHPDDQTNHYKVQEAMKAFNSFYQGAVIGQPKIEYVGQSSQNVIFSVRMNDISMAQEMHNTFNKFLLKQGFKPTGNKEDVNSISRSILNLAADTSTTIISQGQQSVCSKTCWFCGAKDGEESQSIYVPLYRDVIKKWDRNNNACWSWKKTVCSVPRCTECRKIHRIQKLGSSFGCLGVILFYILFFGMFGLLKLDFEDQDYSAAFLYGVFLGPVPAFIFTFLLGRYYLNRRMKKNGAITSREYTKYKFPDIVEIIINGWIVGERPPDAPNFDGGSSVSAEIVLAEIRENEVN